MATGSERDKNSRLSRCPRFQQRERFGYKCIWSGGIGNFIKTTKSEEAIDCLVYTFDLGEFINSKWFEEITDIYTSELWAKKMAIDCEYYELKDLPMYILE